MKMVNCLQVEVHVAAAAAAAAAARSPGLGHRLSAEWLQFGDHATFPLTPEPRFYAPRVDVVGLERATCLQPRWPLSPAHFYLTHPPPPPHFAVSTFSRSNGSSAGSSSVLLNLICVPSFPACLQVCYGHRLCKWTECETAVQCFWTEVVDAEKSWKNGSHFFL